MICQLIGHDYRHAVEEMLFHLFPNQNFTQVDFCEENEDSCISIVKTNEDKITATAKIKFNGKISINIYEKDIIDCDELEIRRRYSEAVRLSIYNAVVEILERPPEWGSLTGVRPAKLARSMFDKGMNNAQAAEYLRNHFSVSNARTALTIRAAAVSQDIKNSLSQEELSIYIGIPFCPSRCAYCSFVSASIDRAGHLIAPYVEELCKEIEQTAQLIKKCNKKITSIYIGGGTPTTLTAQQLTQLMSTVKNNIDISEIREYTVEAGRPDTITEDKLIAIKQGGADRISINPQTMNDDVLKRIGRKHTSKQVEDSYNLARKIGFKVINMDTIVGLDGDSYETFDDTINSLIGLNPENITVHTLAIKRAADLEDKEANIAKRDIVSKMLDNANKKLTQAGYAPYYLYRQKFTAGGFENVGWCKTGTESIYNVCMMEELQDVVSFGAGAISKKVSENGKIERFANPKYPTEYLTSGEKMQRLKEKMFLNYI